MSTHISDLREHLMQTLESLRNRSNPMEPDRARAIATVAGVLVDTARVEVEYIRATDQDTSSFIDSLKTPQGAGGNHERTHWQGGQEHAGGSAAHDGG